MELPVVAVAVAIWMGCDAIDEVAMQLMRLWFTKTVKFGIRHCALTL